MVENIYELKNKLLKHVENETIDMQRMDVKEVGELIDMVKDLAEAEKCCWEASYYRKVTEAMEESSGYTSTGSPANGGGMGYGSTRSGYGSSMRQGYNGSMGHSELIEKLGEEFRNLSPEERMMMKNKVLSVMGSM